MVKSMLLGGAMFVALALPGQAATITVHNLGSVLNTSVSFPSLHTSPGANNHYFEFELPVDEYVSAAVSISGPVNSQLTGTFSLHDWTSTGVNPPFIPAGALIESALLTPANGGQAAVLGTFTPLGDFLLAGNYFVDVAGHTGAGHLVSLAIDGNVTAIAPVPEPATWAMLLLGFTGLAYAGTRSRKDRLAI